MKLFIPKEGRGLCHPVGVLGQREEKSPLITSPTAINQCFVRLAEVNILGVEDLGEGPLRVHVECVRTIQGCPQCGVIAHVKDPPEVELVDLPVYALTCPQLLCHGLC